MILDTTRYKKYKNEAEKKISGESAYSDNLDLLTEHNA